MSIKLPSARFREMFPGTRLVYNHLGEQAFHQFRKDSMVAADTFMTGANQGKLQRAISISSDQAPAYKEIFERQMYARWGVFPLQENAESHRITFRWDLDNPLLYPRRGALHQFFKKRFPYAPPSRAAWAESALQDFIYHLRQQNILTDHTLITKEGALSYHGFMMEGKMSYLSHKGSKLTTSVSREAAEKVLDFAYHRFHFIPDHWPIPLTEEVHQLADAFHFNFLSHITKEALEHKKSH